MAESLAETARRIWQAGVDAADPELAVRRALDGRAPAGRVVVVAVGKAGVAMVRGALASWPVADGIALVPAEGPDLGPVRRLAASHPIPDARGVEAARQIAALVGSLGPGDQLLALVSGGGSALLVDPRPPLDLAGLQAQTRRWLASGEPIETVNAWRIANGTLKGGGLGRLARPADVLTLVLSDVPGRPDLVASGPTAGTGPLIEVGGLQDALDAAGRAAEDAGYTVRWLAPLTGEAADAGRTLARELSTSKGPLALITGGECTVHYTQAGLGGRCQELALSAAIALHGTTDRVLLAAGTDGRDGPTDAAGAWIDGHTADQAGGEAALAAHDSHPWLDRAGALLRTGPTGTNVGDLVVGLIAHPGSGWER